MSENKKSPLLELFQAARGPGATPERAVAPEVAVGLWKERTYTPRVAMTPEEIRQALSEAVQKPLMGPELLAARVALTEVLLPILRQAIEQCAGLELDGYLEALLSGRPVLWEQWPMLRTLKEGKLAFARAPNLEALGTCAHAWANDFAQHLDAVRPCSFRVLENALEGRIDVESVLRLLLLTPAERKEKLDRTERAIESLRIQMKRMPGVQPDGMYVNFARLKCERGLLQASLSIEDE